MPLLDLITEFLRPKTFHGKGRLFNWCTPKNGRREIAVHGPVRMSIDLANAQQRQMFMGCINIELQRTMRALLRPGDIFLDVGANVGYFSMLASHLVAPGGQVFSIEPFGPNYQDLANNIELSDTTNVKSLNVALTEKPGSLRLFIPPAGEHREFNVSILSHDNHTVVEVPALTLDDCIRDWNLPRIRLMKIDVEGSESSVFKGGQQSLSSGVVEYLSCEMNAHYQKRLGRSQKALYEEIKSYGFVPAILQGARAVPLSDDVVFHEQGDADQLFVHQSLARLG